MGKNIFPIYAINIPKHMLKFIQTIYLCCSLEGMVSYRALLAYRLWMPAHIPKPNLPIIMVGVVSIILIKLKIIEIRFDHKNAFLVSPSKKILATFMAVL